MPQYLAALTTVLLLGTVVGRVLLLRRTGTHAMHFGKLDKTDFLIPPVALFYFYTLFATAFGWPLAIDRQVLPVHCCRVGRGGALPGRGVDPGVQPGVVRKQLPGRHRCRAAGSAGDDGHIRGEPQSDLCRLLPVPAAVSSWRSPVGPLSPPLAFAAVLFHRQVLREEEFMRQRYGQEYAEYCSRVRRYGGHRARWLSQPSRTATPL